MRLESGFILFLHLPPDFPKALAILLPGLPPRVSQGAVHGKRPQVRSGALVPIDSINGVFAALDIRARVFLNLQSA